MFTRLGDTTKATIFTVLVLLLALAAALLVRALGLTSESFRAVLLYMSTPTLAMLLMLLAVTRDGYSMEGWKVLGLHRLGLKAWWIAFLAPLLVGVVATAIVWATPLAKRLRQ
jgi:uncharacterized protein